MCLIELGDSATSTLPAKILSNVGCCAVCVCARVPVCLRASWVGEMQEHLQEAEEELDRARCILLVNFSTFQHCENGKSAVKLELCLLKRTLSSGELERVAAELRRERREAMQVSASCLGAAGVTDGCRCAVRLSSHAHVSLTIDTRPRLLRTNTANCTSL